MFHELMAAIFGQRQKNGRYLERRHLEKNWDIGGYLRPCLDHEYHVSPNDVYDPYVTQRQDDDYIPAVITALDGGTWKSTCDMFPGCGMLEMMLLRYVQAWAKK
ncbi:hypothetical protein MGG_16511 [Pyricularia oryzae 70-15]|uniref:Uncharacterized protein n=1 Tax=Pyricularia oryzae (strain 70-15 / ATCC MYA-4617 / FGSC 8958) TaxID=242507 RepID=G4MRR4_PYRO7|nr:uncharacterized protein MGG_16511 [Pyricularia oryzae 70-15]EHA58279.1 hypothetical protein MGG_16511 [Pyricularia oryzae 70-15]